jgi:peptidyl-prolyl cis-trans isomerase D
MPFEVFRRHQRKLLAIFAILAMFGFVVSDSLPKLLNSGNAGRDQLVVNLFGKPIYRSALNELIEQRSLANMFVSQLNPYVGPRPFGATRDRDVVDALILQREADRLGLPAGSEMGKEYLKQITGGAMNRDLFEMLLARLNNRVSGDQLLADIANQVRLAHVRQLLSAPLVTPYDVFQAYRDQNERVAAKLVEIPVEKFLGKVPEPTPEEIASLYEKYKDVLPDPARETPGFKVPRQIQLEILSIDGNALSRGINDRLTDAELRASYESRKAEFQERSELPNDLFAGQPELTPPIVRPFGDVRNQLAIALAEEKAQAEIGEKFAKIKDEVLIPFYEEYASAQEEMEEARKLGTPSKKSLPAPIDLRALAQREGLNYESTPLLAREQAEQFGQISGAEVGISRLSGGRKFADEFFDPKKALYEPEELTDLLGTRFLVRKIKDVAPHIPALELVRPDVSLAWKVAKARPLAEKAAQELAERLKKKPDSLKENTIEGYRVVSVPAIARLQTNFLASRFESGTPEETPIPDVSYPGESLRKAYFDLQPGSVAVATNQPNTIYYVMVPERREPATFAALYAPNGDDLRYKNSASQQARRQLDEQWMGWLRKQAGLDSGWIPPDEAKGRFSSDDDDA